MNKTKCYLWKVIWRNLFFLGNYFSILYAPIVSAVICAHRRKSDCSPLKYLSEWWCIIYYGGWKMAMEENVCQCAETSAWWLDCSFLCALDKVLLGSSCSLHQTPRPGKSQEGTVKCWLKNSLKIYELNNVNVKTTSSQKYWIFKTLVLCRFV